MNKLRHLIEHHFSIVLLLSCLAGLTVPGLPSLPNVSAIITLALLMFLSCYKLREGGFSELRIRDIAGFYLLRYVLLPPFLFLLARWLLPHYASAIFLLTLVPAAVSSPAFAMIYGGRTALAFAIVIVSQLLTPLLIPLQFSLIGGIANAPDPSSLFVTLLWCIAAPMVIYALIRNHKPTADYVSRQGKFYSIILIAFIIALAVAKQRSVILDNVGAVLTPFLISLGCLATYLFTGWFFASSRPREERITYSVCSVFNNAALAVSLALIHFPGDVLLFVAVSEIAWSFLPLMMKLFLSFCNKSPN